MPVTFLQQPKQKDEYQHMLWKTVREVELENWWPSRITQRNKLAALGVDISAESVTTSTAHVVRPSIP